MIVVRLLGMGACDEKIVLRIENDAKRIRLVFEATAPRKGRDARSEGFLPLAFVHDSLWGRKGVLSQFIERNGGTVDHRPVGSRGWVRYCFDLPAATPALA